MPKLIIKVTHKRQTKMLDCWYACIQVLLTTRHGEKTKPKGNAIANHRKMPLTGKKLSFSSNTGAIVMKENGLVEMSKYASSSGYNIQDVLTGLKKNGPIIICGAYGPLGCGHCVVITGADTDLDQIQIEDPGWGKGSKWQSIDYLNKMHVTPESAVALAAMAG
jgi:hypothetical protein